MKFLKFLLENIFGNKQEFTFEERLISMFMLCAGLVCFISIFINSGLNLNPVSVFILIISFIIFSVIFILNRFLRYAKFSKWVFTAYSLLFTNFLWFVNYGSQGSIIYIFLVYLFIMVFAWESFRIWLIALVVLINVLILFVIEITDPGFLGRYPNEEARIADTYFTFIVVLIFFLIIVLNAKNNYVRQYKRAQHADRLKSAFLANISHEIRTPLNAVMGFTQLLTSREVTREKKEFYSKMIIENSEFLMQLVSDILDISLIEAGQLTVRKNKFNLTTLFNKMYYNYKQLLDITGKQHIELNLKLPPKSVTVESDETRIEQILTNILNNAVKFTSKGFIKFGYTQINHEILFFVEDSGHGIKEEFKPLIFNRFVKDENFTDERFFRGAGIGLSLVKELVQLLNGKIWFQSELNKGTSFFVSIPQFQQ